MSKVVGYVRVSTSEQDLSVEAQRDALRNWCASNGLALAAMYEDVGTSGSAPIEKRPGLRAALEALEEGDTLLVLRRDRLARSVVTAATADALATKAGATIRTVHEGCDEESTPETMLMNCILDAFAQYERALIRMRIKSAMNRKRERGEVLGSIPYGWKPGRDGVRLEVNPKEQDAIFTARALKEEGLSLRAIALQLVERGHLPRKGNAWHPETVKHLLSAKVLDWPEAARS
jgi:DNA invertase Pin-like site-specific DNA recombinase